MSDDAGLIAAAGKVDIMDVAGRILARPRRGATSATVAQIFALAWAAEKFWAVAIEAELLARAVRLPETGNQNGDAAKDHAVQLQVDRVLALMAEIRGEPNTETHQQETDHGSSHS